MEALEPVFNFVDQNGALTIVLLTATLLLIRSVIVAIPKMVRILGHDPLKVANRRFLKFWFAWSKAREAAAAKIRLYRPPIRCYLAITRVFAHLSPHYIGISDLEVSRPDQRLKWPLLFAVHEHQRPQGRSTSR